MRRGGGLPKGKGLASLGERLSFEKIKGLGGETVRGKKKIRGPAPREKKKKKPFHLKRTLYPREREKNPLKTFFQGGGRSAKGRPGECLSREKTPAYEGKKGVALSR